MTPKKKKKKKKEKAEKKRRGPQPEVFRVPLRFEEAVEAALKTKPPKKNED
jgi:hypothetical protein